MIGHITEKAARRAEADDLIHERPAQPVATWGMR